MMTNIIAVEKAERCPILVGKLLEIWEASVRSSHRFLTEADIRTLAPQAREAIMQIETLWIVMDGPMPAGSKGIFRTGCAICRCQ